MTKQELYELNRIAHGLSLAMRSGQTRSEVKPGRARSYLDLLAWDDEPGSQTADKGAPHCVMKFHCNKKGQDNE